MSDKNFLVLLFLNSPNARLTGYYLSVPRKIIRKLLMTKQNKKMQPIVGVSACLRGELVRYDGTHKLQATLEPILSPFVSLVSVCPEVSAGLGVPRPTIQLHHVNNSVRALTHRNIVNSIDVTDALKNVAVEFLHQQRRLPLCGYIFKSRSPSCGLGSTPIANAPGKSTNGVFADAIQKQGLPLVMIEESWLVNEARHFRFLSACFLLFYCRYSSGEGNSINQKLFSIFDLTPTSVRNLATVQRCIENCLDPKPKTALDERLCDYWCQRRHTLAVR